MVKSIAEAILAENRKRLGLWSWEQKRCFQRFMSGMRRAAALGDTVRFLTLTTAKESRFANDYGALARHFTALCKRIEHYLTLWNPDGKLFRHLPFEYCKIVTHEGFGVIHLLYHSWGDCGYIDQEWLSEAWKELHGSPVVFIRKVYLEIGIARYIVGSYLSDQGEFRISWSQGWVFKGFVKEWRTLCKKHKYDLKKVVMIWNRYLDGTIPHFSIKKLMEKKKG